MELCIYIFKIVIDILNFVILNNENIIFCQKKLLKYWLALIRKKKI